MEPLRAEPVRAIYHERDADGEIDCHHSGGPRFLGTVPIYAFHGCSLRTTITELAK